MVAVGRWPAAAVTMKAQYRVVLCIASVTAWPWPSHLGAATAGLLQSPQNNNNIDLQCKTNSIS